MSISGRYYDGKTSRTIEAVCSSDEDGCVSVSCAEDGEELVSANLDLINISPRLANTPRYFFFPEGGKFETSDNSAVDRLQERFGKGSWLNIVHFFESRIKYVLIALFVLIFVMWCGVRYGVPIAAKTIALHLPVKVIDIAGARTLAFLDKSFFKPSELTAKRQSAILDHFQPGLDSHTNLKVSILFRKGGPIGPNAFALPNGVILFTDEMIQTAIDNDELLAVLFHEIGHLVHRHGMRTVIQDSLLGFALMALTGDVTGSAEIFMGLPVFFTQMAYSRGFEKQADQYALKKLKQAGIPTVHFVNLMERIEHKMNRLNKNSDNTKKWISYLSTHPRMAERLRPFRNE
ncbi:MAG: M48 family metallopeptidase [Desulfobacula sp.]|nr:M48 family metallopeptidase [Desulfobacula sp.]